MDASSSSNSTGKPKQARLAEAPPALPTKGPANLNHNDEDVNDEHSDGAESDFDESTVKTEGGLVSKLENLDERAFEDKKKVALREQQQSDNNAENGKEGEEEEEDEETSNAGELEAGQDVPDSGCISDSEDRSDRA